MGLSASRRSPFPRERTPAILVVEDEVLIRLVISAYLQECGFHVYEAGNSMEAIRILEATHTPIDLVFSDVAMPGEIDGFGLSHWVRKHRPGMPVLLTSGDAKKSAAARELCENEPFLTKPYDLDQVVAQIRKVIDATKSKGEDGER
jgi:DNA-binding NtrC family response regulator